MEKRSRVTEATPQDWEDFGMLLKNLVHGMSSEKDSMKT